MKHSLVTITVKYQMQGVTELRFGQLYIKLLLLILKKNGQVKQHASFDKEFIYILVKEPNTKNQASNQIKLLNKQQRL